jgi:hypothetical protein
MIGMAKSCSGGGALANYVMNDIKGYELDRNNICGTTPKEIVEEMKMIQDLNQRATNKTFSMVISPDIKDGKNLSDDELREITKDYLNKLGIDTEKQQYVAFVHTEKEHKHIHIIANRVQPNGKLISDHHIGKRGQWIAHEIAKEKGLISAKEKMFENIRTIEKGTNSLKNEIYKKHQEVLKQNPKSFENYILLMKKKGLEVKPTVNRQGELQGFRVRDLKTEKEFKASEVNRLMSASNLIKSGLKNDLNHNLDTTLKRVQGKQLSKSNPSKNLGNSIPKGIKNELKQVKNIGEFQVKSTAKSLIKTFVKTPKMTKEEFKEELKFEKHFDEVINPNLLITMNTYWDDLQKANELSKLQEDKLQIEQDKNNEPKDNNLKLELDR